MRRTARSDWTQKLASVRDPITRDVGRRVQSVNLAFGDGILVCPTNSGAVLGVDLLTHSLIWAHPYHKVNAAAAAPPRNPRAWQFQPMAGTSLTPDWKASAPIVQDGGLSSRPPMATRSAASTFVTARWSGNRAARATCTLAASTTAR